MNQKTLLIILIVIVSGTVVAASSFPQDEGNEITADEHECPHEMTDDEEQGEDHSMENCDMTDTTMEGCSSMMDNTDHMTYPDHCEDMGSMMEGPIMEEHMGKTMSF